MICLMNNKVANILNTNAYSLHYRPDTYIHTPDRLSHNKAKVPIMQFFRMFLSQTEWSDQPFFEAWSTIIAPPTLTILPLWLTEQFMCWSSHAGSNVEQRSVKWK